MKFADLFCGVGGTSFGAAAFGLEPHILIDNDPLIEKALAPCFKEKFVRHDLSMLNDDIRENIINTEALFCSPPCQSYSNLRTRNSTSQPSDLDQSLVKSIAEIIRYGSYKIVLIENVPAFLKSYQATLILQALLSKGFHICAGVYDAASFGVPQRRKRSIILGTTRTLKLKETNDIKSVKDAFVNLPQINGSDPLHQAKRNHSTLVKERIANIPKNGGSRNALPEHLVLECHKKTNGYHDIYGRMSWNTYSPTITSGCTNPSKGRFLHPTEDRAITLREASRLQTLPDKLRLSDISSNQARAKLIGNAFPSKMVFEILCQCE